MVINGRKIVALCFRSPLQCLISLFQPPSETLQLPNLFVILSQQIFQLLPNSATCPCHHDKEKQSFNAVECEGKKRQVDKAHNPHMQQWEMVCR